MSLVLHRAVVVLPVVNPAPVEPPGVSGDINTMLGYLMWAGGIVCFISLVIVGIVFMLNATGRIGGAGAEEIVGRVGWLVLGSGVLGGASAIGYALTGV